MSQFEFCVETKVLTRKGVQSRETLRQSLIAIRQLRIAVLQIRISCNLGPCTVSRGHSQEKVALPQMTEADKGCVHGRIVGRRRWGFKIRNLPMTSPAETATDPYPLPWLNTRAGACHGSGVAPVWCREATVDKKTPIAIAHGAEPEPTAGLFD